MSFVKPLKSIQIALFTYGGVHRETIMSLFAEAHHCGQLGVGVEISRRNSDALISRARSVAATRFLETSDADVLFMVDHDVAWQVGDLEATAQEAHDTGAVVGGLYSNRGFGAGLSSHFLKEGVEFAPGGRKLHESRRVASGFMAIPRRVLQRVLYSRPDDPFLRVYRCSNFGEDFDSFFMPFPESVENNDEGVGESAAPRYEYLSEDWAFCARVRNAKIPCYIFEKPILVHFGEYGFQQTDGLINLDARVAQGGQNE